MNGDLELSIQEMQEIELDILRNIYQISERHNVKSFVCFGTALGAVRHKGFIPWDHDTDICVFNDDFDVFLPALQKEIDEKYCVSYGPYDCPVPFVRVGLKGYSTLTLHIDVYVVMGLPDKKNEQVKLLKRISKMSKIYTVKKTFSFNKNTTLFYKMKQLLIMAFLCFVDTKRLFGKISRLVFSYPVSSFDYCTIPYIEVYGDKKIFHKSVFGEGKNEPFADISVRVPSDYRCYLKQLYGNYMEYPSSTHRDAMLKKRFIVKAEYLNKE